MSAAMQRPNIQQFGTEVPHAQGFRLMADAVIEVSPLIAELSNRIADDPEVLALLDSLSPGQLPTQIHCVVSYLLTKNANDPLNAYFPCYTPTPLPLQDAYPAFREFCLKHQDDIRDLMAARTMQLTFPERAVPVLFALEAVANACEGPIDLIEVGCSAGLLLHFDRYHYDFGQTGVFGDSGSSVTVKAELRGERAHIPPAMPAIGERAGIDLHPVNLKNVDEIQWVLAAIGPERLATRASTTDALALASQLPLHVLRGDAVKELAGMAARMPNTLCVMNSHCMYQWPAQVCSDFDALLCQISEDRDVHRISIESRNRGPADIVHMIYRGGCLADVTTLGNADKFGRWVEFTDAA